MITTIPEYKLELIKAMERCGATVLTEDKGGQFVVKIRMPGMKQIKTGSSSGYPIEHAYLLWVQENPDAEVLS